ncbi:MAG: CoA-binding protein, partial [Methylobacterium organophilum]|nr:CoA-binding protein [Methylobacterium organophilum]
MSTYRFDKLLAPRSIALVGAVGRAGSLGRSVLDSLRAAGFPGAIMPVQPDQATVEGLPCVPRVADLPAAPDLVLIAVPPPSVPEVVAQAAAIGAGA